MSNEDLLLKDMEFSVDEMNGIDYRKLCNQFNEIALVLNPLLLTFDEAEFMIETSRIPPRIVICFTFLYKQKKMYVYDLLQPNPSKGIFYFNPGYIFSVIENRLNNFIRKILTEDKKEGLDE